MAIYIVVQDFLLEMFVTDQNPDRQIDQQTNIATIIAKQKNVGLYPTNVLENVTKNMKLIY